jgi:hypothetical protein
MKGNGWNYTVISIPKEQSPLNRKLSCVVLGCYKVTLHRIDQLLTLLLLWDNQTSQELW